MFAWWPVCPFQVEDVDMVFSYQIISKGTDEGLKVAEPTELCYTSCSINHECDQILMQILHTNKDCS